MLKLGCGLQPLRLADDRRRWPRRRRACLVCSREGRGLPQCVGEAVLGPTDSELADRSGLSRAAIHRLTTAALRAIPDPDTLNKLAVALDVSIDRVAVAALHSAGVPVTDRFATGDVLEGLDRVSPQQRAAIQRLVEVMINPTAAE